MSKDEVLALLVGFQSAPFIQHRVCAEHGDLVPWTDGEGVYLLYCPGVDCVYQEVVDEDMVFQMRMQMEVLKAFLPRVNPDDSSGAEPSNPDP